MDNVFISFCNYNKRVVQIIRSKLNIFLLFFAVMLLIQGLNLNNINVIGLFIKLAIEAILKLAVVFILLYPNNTFNNQALEHFKRFISQKYWKVFFCLMVFFLISFAGVLLLVLPGLLAFFFFQYSYLYVALENDPVKEAFMKSAKLVMKILGLNLLMLGVYSIFILFFAAISIVYIQSILITLGTLYLAMLKTIVFLDNYKKI